MENKEDKQNKHTVLICGSGYASAFACGILSLIKQKYPNMTQEDLFKYLENDFEPINKTE